MFLNPKNINRCARGYLNKGAPMNGAYYLKQKFNC